MPYPMKNSLPTTRLDPKSAVPDPILEQYPWHWDPMEKNHNDDAHHQGTIDFNWKELGDWAIEKANLDKTPQKYWWYDDENQAVMHAKDNVNHCPIYEQALQHVKQNNYNIHNTQYFKYANEDLEDFFEPLKNIFPEMNKVGISLFVQPPGHTIPSHVDTYSSFMRRTEEYPDYTKVKRYMIFVRDWDWGHFFHWGNVCINQWKAGDFWNLRNGIYHGSANAGINPKITIHWSGEVE